MFLFRSSGKRAGKTDMGRLKKGFVHIYTGDGKGKTTAALGLALRAAGAGLKVYICQFMKNGRYGEIKTLSKIKGIKIEQFGRGCFVKNNPKKKDIECAREGLEKAASCVSSGRYDVVILDELNVAVKLGLIALEDVIGLIDLRPIFVELVLTGRDCPSKLFKYADIVTCMKEVKHHYNNGIKSRRGIEY